MYCERIDPIRFNHYLNELYYDQLISISEMRNIDSVLSINSLVDIRSKYNKMIDDKDPDSYQVLLNSIKSGNDEIGDLLNYLNEINLLREERLRIIFSLLN